MRMDGKWHKLTEWLENNSQNEITLSDDEMCHIVGSTQKVRPLQLDYTNEEYSIRTKASNAGYSVVSDSRNKIIKIFRKI